MVKVNHGTPPKLPYSFCGRKATEEECRIDGRHNDWVGISGPLSVRTKPLPRIGKMKEIDFFVALGDYCGLFEYNTTLVCPECAQENGLLW